MTSHIEVALGTFPELVDIFTNELLGNEIDEARKEKLVDKLKKIEMKPANFSGHIYMPSIGQDHVPDFDWEHSPKSAVSVNQFMEKQQVPIGIQESTTFVSGLLEAISQLDNEEQVLKYTTHAFNNWYELPTQIMQPWRSRRIPLCYLHYYNVDGINVAGVDKLHDLKDIVELAKLYPQSKDVALSLFTVLKSEGLRAIITVLNNIAHVRQFNRFVKLLASPQLIEELRLDTEHFTTAELESEYESVLEDINASLFRSSIDIRQFAYLRVIDLLLG